MSSLFLLFMQNSKYFFNSNPMHSFSLTGRHYKARIVRFDTVTWLRQCEKVGVC